ncbi:MAG: hypothetical protein ACM3QZ_13545 [Solirubrobacterales bacterium]
MDKQRGLANTLGTWLVTSGCNIGALYLILASISGCTGSCGMCGFGCIQSAAGIAGGGVLLMAGKGIKRLV